LDPREEAAFLQKYHTIAVSPAPQAPGIVTAQLPFLWTPAATGELTDMHQKATLMHMRTTLIIDDVLLEKARQLCGLTGKTAVVHAGLKALIARESARQLAALGGSMPNLRPVPRRRPKAAR
jgi:Arc/MetJ family transcription regulator